MSEQKVCLIVTTHLDLERITANRIKEELNLPACSSPRGYRGLVLVYCSSGNVDELAQMVASRIVEAERVLPIHIQTKADPELICEAVKSLALKELKSSETFAVRTERRGHHAFSSLDVNVKAGACIQAATGSPVDLENPAKIFWVEIIEEEAYISVTPGSILWKKNYDVKPEALRYLRKVVLAQVPYIAEPQASFNIGVRIGRAVQSFEIKELVLTPYLPVDAESLLNFLKGILEGINSRYKIQVKSYAHPVHKTRVLLFDLYQLLREYREKGTPIIATSTRGRYIGEVASQLKELFEKHKEVLVLIGSREGLPAGVLRFSDMVVDVMPGVTLATDIASTAILTALTNVLIKMGES
ncbi:MAG: SPOUT family RNA methylase [Infirmifilum sp.]